MSDTAVSISGVAPSRRRTRRRRAALAAALLVVAGQVVFWMEPIAAFTVAEWLAPNVVWRFETEEPLVALSFDDGPDPTHTPRILSLLERHGARATFFLIGERARAHPGVVERIKSAGHEVGNHFFTNGTALAHSDADFVSHLRLTESAVGLTGPVKLFRPPGGLAWPGQVQLACENGYTTVLGSAYPHDPAHPPVWYIRWLVVKNLAPGAIVILHDGIRDPRRTIEALPAILSDGRRKGYEFVTIGTLMNTPGATHSGRRCESGRP